MLKSFLMLLFFSSFFSLKPEEKNILLNETKIDLIFDYEHLHEYNKGLQDVGENGILNLDSIYDASKVLIIFNSSDLEEKYSFITKMKDDNGNIYNIKCKLWYFCNDFVIFCELKNNLKVGIHEITLDNASFIYKGYLFNISFPDKFYINKTNTIFPFIYSEEQIINISDKEELYELKFKAESYHNETLILKFDAYNGKILEECSLYNKDLICKIKKQELIEILTINGSTFYLAFYNSFYGLVGFKYTFNIKINLNINKKENIYIDITKVLVNITTLNSIFTYETNINEDFPNIITEPFKLKIFPKAECYFRKYASKPLLFYCLALTKGIFPLESITEEIILDNIHSKYNFIIKSININEKIKIIEEPKNTFHNRVSLSIPSIPSILNFDLNDKLNIDIFTFSTNIRLNPDSDDLKCQKINDRAQRCIITKSHFENKSNGYYFVHYLNPATNEYTPFYDSGPIKVVLSQNNQKIIYSQQIASNNCSKWKISSIVVITFISLLLIYSIFYAYREYLRKNKEKLFEDLVDKN